MDNSANAALASEGRSFLQTPLERIVGKRSASALAKLNLTTVGELLFHVPFRLARRGELMPIEAVREGEAVTVVARVLSTTLRPMHARRGFLLSVVITDGEHDLELTFFAKNQYPVKFHERQLQPGTLATFSGTISSYRGHLQLAHPDYELVDNESDVDAQVLAQPIPIYHGSAKMPSWKIARAVELLLPLINEQSVPELLPAHYLQQHSLPSRADALRALHAPVDQAQWDLAALRMKHEEAFMLQALLEQQAVAARAVAAPCAAIVDGGARERFLAALPFTLTAGQERVIGEISAQLTQRIPMRRLLQGDVGSGKTVVALAAMLQALDAGQQAVLLAPTEVLAAQHFAAIHKLLAECEVPALLLTGALGGAEKRAVLTRIASGEPLLVVGTHALLQEGVEFAKLGLVVIDEQHRFGVDQRDKLSAGTHMLVLTATPIPRTVAMTYFGDLEVSTLDEVPTSRKPVQTSLVPEWNTAWMERMWQRAVEEVGTGGRVFVVCPRISARDSEQLDHEFADQSELELGLAPISASQNARDLHSVEAVSEQLRTDSRFSQVHIGVVHGGMASELKTKAMRDFASGHTQLLIATTVIEVGVDVPEATMMVILDADRFGLAQLHQLRGRIGRGDRGGLCLAVHQAAEGTLALNRLEAFASTTDGFALAQRDLELRSEGNVLGTQQSGVRSSLQFLQVLRDEAIITSARAGATALLEQDPHLESHELLRAELIERAKRSESQYLDKN